MSRPKSNSKNRYAVVRVIAMIALICLIGRLFYIQIIKHSKYEQIAVSQQTQDIAIEAKRGTITDRDGNILAISATAYKVVMAPKLIDSEDLREKICDGLSSALSEDRDKIYEMTLKNVQSVEVVRRVEKDIADKVSDFISEDKDYAAIITVTEDPKRYYPNGNTLSTVLGLVGADNQGLEGLEYLYDDYLTGTAGKLVATKTSIGTSMPFSHERQVDPKDGCTVELTVDLKMQAMFESEINNARVEHNVQNRIAGVIMDVNTGEILAMTSKPDFDPNENYVINDELTLEALAAEFEVGSTEYYKAYNEKFAEYKKNKCLEAYEPGSTFKIFTASMALEENLVSLEETFFCSGHLDIGPTRVNCHKRTGHGSEHLKEGLANSCNPVFMTLGMRIGQEKFYDYLTVFGLRDKTGVGLPGEQTGYHHSLKTMTTLDLAESAFGQTFKITPMQLISGVCSVINGGNYMQPYIVRSITDSDGNTVVSNKPTVVRQTVSDETSAIMREYLEFTADSSEKSHVDGYRIGGKTGTSQKLDTRVGQEDNDKRIASYVCFAPADDPQIAVLVVVDEPDSEVQYGSYIAAPLGTSIIVQALNQLGIYSTAENADRTTVPYVGEMTVDEASKKIVADGLQVKVVGKGETVVSQLPAANTTISVGSTVLLYTEEGEHETTTVVPNLEGKTPAECNQLLTNSELNIEILGSNESVTPITGSGVVAYYQSISPGETVEKMTTVQVRFKKVAKSG